MKKEDLKSWKLLGRTILFQHPRLKVAEDEVLLPNGITRKWLLHLDRRDYVTILARDSADKIIVAYQYNHVPQEVIAEFPGGIIEKGEEPVVAAQRELEEEIGFYPHQAVYLGSYFANNRRSDHKAHVILATDLEQRVATPEPEEFIAWEWLDSAEIDQQIIQGKLGNSSLLAAWGIYKAYQSSVSNSLR